MSDRMSGASAAVAARIKAEADTFGLEAMTLGSQRAVKAAAGLAL